MRSRYVEKAELVGAFAVVDASDLGRVAGVFELEKPNALDDPTRFDIETWNDSLGEHACRSV
jgi:hypothetical protein